MIVVTLYHDESQKEESLAEAILTELQGEVPHQLVKVNVDGDPALQKVYKEHLPVIEVGPFILREPYITRQDILVALMSARDRKSDLERIGDKDYLRRVEKSKQFSGADRFSHWFSMRYMLLFNLIVFIYVGLPFLAPVLMKVGAPTPAKIIYSIYSPLCHQLAFRSWFLFGEQSVYPRELAQLDELKTYEEISGTREVNIIDAREFIGNEEIGYKVAFCERDIAIYAGILLFGIVFAVSGRKIRALPWYFWIVLGIIPIGLDGGSQLPGLVKEFLPSWLLIVERESTPFLRTLTGGLFGITTAWYLYPMIEETMQDTRRVLMRKKAVFEQVNSSKE